MKFKLIPRLKPYLDLKDLFQIFKISSGNMKKFEIKFAKKFECNYGIMFQHGRSGLYSLFKILELNNDEIICPAYTCVVVAHSIVLSGNIPVFVDCEINSPNMSYEKLEKSINEKTRAIIITHLFGYPMNLEKIELIVKKYEKLYNKKIYVIQDVAHSFGAKWNDKLVTKSGDAAIFGLNISKTITSIFGGMITTNNKDIYEKLISYRDNNFKKKGIIKSFKRLIYLISVYFAFNKYIYKFVNLLENSGLLNRFVKYYDEDKIYFPRDWDEIPTELEARIGLSQLEKYDKIIEIRKTNAIRYIEELKKNNELKFFKDLEGSTYSHLVALVDNRTQWIEKYHKKGIQLGILIEYSIPYMKAYKKYKKEEFPISKYYSEHTINFPIFH